MNKGVDESDTQYQEQAITQVESGPERHTLQLDDGWYLNIEHGPIVPEPGMVIRMYGRGIGSPVRGVVIDGQVFSYQTAAEFEAERAAEIARDKMLRAEAYQRWLPQREAELAKLPEVFQRRLNRFLENAPDTAWDHQGYELAVCHAALAIAGACETGEEARAFSPLPYDEQISRAPTLDSLGLSGNQLGMACRLAYHYLTDPENVWKEHACISILVGCKEAGCIPVVES